MKKRIISLLIILVFCGVLFEGCSGGSKGESSEESKKTIKFATFYSDKDQGAIYKDLAKDFEKSNKDIKVEVVTDFGNDDKLKEAYTGKGEFDIIGIKRNQLIEYAKSGLLKDASDMIDSNQLNKKLYKICLAYGEYNGKAYGIGDLPMSMEWFYNPGIFTRNKLKEPSTLKDLIAVSQKLKAQKLIPIGIGAIDGWTLTSFFGLITAQTSGVNEFTTNYGSDINAFKKITSVNNAFAIFSKLSGTAILTNSDEVNYKQSVQDFVNGKTAILPAGSWAVELIDQIKPSGFNYGIIKNNISFTPAPRSLYSATAGEVLTIPSNSKNSKEAEKFLNFIFSDEAQKKFMEKGYISPVIKANIAENDVKKQILKHIEMADGNSIMLIDNLDPVMLESLTMVLKDELQGRVKSSEAWGRVLRLTYQR